jgi:hypothetical protein
MRKLNLFLTIIGMLFASSVMADDDNDLNICQDYLDTLNLLTEIKTFQLQQEMSLFSLNTAVSAYPFTPVWYKWKEYYTAENKIEKFNILKEINNLTK